MIYLIGLMFFCAGPALQAQTVVPEKLVTFTNDQDSASSELFLTFYDDSYLKGLRVVNKEAGNTTETEYLISYMELKAIPAFSRGGEAILNFSGTTDSAIGKGVLHFRFFSSHGGEQCNVALKRNDQGHWQLLSPYTGQAITEAKLTLKDQFVESISGICH